MTSQLTLKDTFAPYYTIGLERDTVEFLWSSVTQEALESSVDLKIKIQTSELYSLAEKLGCTARQGKIVIPTFDAYNRLLIYACVRPLLRKPEKVEELTRLVFEINSLDALYWASRFREVWWEHGKYRRIIKFAKAFKLFFSLE